MLPIHNIICKSPEAADEALEALGLDREVLEQSVWRGQAKRNEATPHHPANAGGQFAYLEAVRSVRDGLKPREWKAKNEKNLELTISPDGKTAIVVSGGDKHTGTLQNPSSRNEKGTETKRRVEYNHHLPFVEPEMQAQQEETSTNEYEVWWLLYYFDKKMREVRCELSLPTGMNDKDRISDWSKRILLSPLTLDSEPSVKAIDKSPNYSEEVEIDVVFRAQNE
ncbi:hypothetical protein QKW35_14545 [Pontibacterium granulatum]|uniref:hypothetical protein n=1 Tax=Pontibacterium granulatum TaxID=2036029 RepID=UPI00249C3D15|nr:hypothetical protein [Pontibacterium granulatum]MDI3325595.1 hypothetical protein [Pontibacterium granulatum]